MSKSDQVRNCVFPIITISVFAGMYLNPVAALIWRGPGEQPYSPILGGYGNRAGESGVCNSLVDMFLSIESTSNLAVVGPSVNPW